LKRLLIIQTAFIGDVILASGLISKLHRFYPELKIDFLLRKDNEILLSQNPYINELIIWDKKNNKFGNFLKIIKKIRSNRYDYVINIHRFLSSGIITALSAADNKIGFNKNPLSFLFTKKLHHIIGNSEHPKHEIDRNNDLIRHLTDNKAEKPQLFTGDADISVRNYKLLPYICIAPASVWETKQYPAHKWIEFINSIESIDKIYLLGSKNDFIMGEILKNQVKAEIIVENLCGKLNLLQSASLMKDAKMNFVNDSGPLHLASAVNANITAVFCSTVPEFGFGPVSDNSFIIETTKKLSCRPCSLHGFKSCPEKHFDCANTIDKQQLLVRI